MSIGDNIRTVRKLQGLTQKELARRLGISPVGVAQWENGLRNPKHEKEMENEMATSNSNNLVNPNAREAMNRFKMEAASEVGVNLKQGYNGDLTSRQAGSIGGQMVKKMIAAYENGMQ